MLLLQMSLELAGIDRLQAESAMGRVEVVWLLSVLLQRRRMFWQEQHLQRRLRAFPRLLCFRLGQVQDAFFLNQPVVEIWVNLGNASLA